MQYTGLLYDKMTSIETYRGWSEGQMKYLLGNNAAKQCFVIGYNAYGPKYPHHRAASGYTGKDQGTTAQKNHVNRCFGWRTENRGSYVDSASDYVCNEVAIDYNATLVAAAAAIYEKVHIRYRTSVYRQKFFHPVAVPHLMYRRRLQQQVLL